jgi:hypothetical protein
MHTGALVPRRSTTAGVPGPRRNADECDAGWFAPVATRRRSMLVGPCPPGREVYSVFWNSPMAMTSIDTPMTATIASDSHCGTSHPDQVTPGASACTACGLTDR